MLKPRTVKESKPKDFRTGIRINKDVWDQLGIAGQALNIKKGELLETIIKEWLTKNKGKITFFLDEKVSGFTAEEQTHDE